VIMRERNGRALPFVVRKEGDGIPFVREHVEPGTIVYADENREWDRLHASYDARRIYHSAEYSRDDISTNAAEWFFSHPPPPRRDRPAPSYQRRVSGRLCE
jgi:hypothetical protein